MLSRLFFVASVLVLAFDEEAEFESTPAACSPHTGGSCTVFWRNSWSGLTNYIQFQRVCSKGYCDIHFEKRSSFFIEEEEVGFSNSNLAQRQPSADDSMIGHVADVLGDT